MFFVNLQWQGESSDWADMCKYTEKQGTISATVWSLGGYQSLTPTELTFYQMLFSAASICVQLIKTSPHEDIWGGGLFCTPEFDGGE
jgi:hypothetical protein